MREGGRRMVCLSDHCGFLGLYVTWGEASVKGFTSDGHGSKKYWPVSVRGITNYFITGL